MPARRLLAPTAVFASVALIWWLAGRAGWTNAYLLPAPSTVAAALSDLAASGALLKHTLISLQRVLLGFALSVALALPLAVLLSASRPARVVLDPLLEFVRQVPPLALIPLLILWLGIGEAQKLGIIVLASFFPVFLGFRGGIAGVDPKLIEVGRVAGLTRRDILTRIVLPSALPELVVGLRISLGYSWRALVGAELIASSAGLGYMIIDAENLARTDIVLAGILVIGAIGLLSDLVLRLAVTRAFPWLSADLEAARA
ncbi:putative aliphatic sulfonates transport permease protein SsuC [uncultured Pleomorphomonas sp.]|uniref:ABC transporter permease n=2 Tax=Pleomorphomonas TaxID=261933 RepID=A0A2G9WQS3_9HYPH|nr:ABC transporter permease [Pleomorphomonas carboxyditropha]PIO96662.1 ABC transporter permease [Pleomorphomonas carboxyditropha]SCM74431.1 putative aliphatic sulfonates transport permease protein SsuC [uncultured Pleomorphomonas sp.]